MNPSNFGNRVRPYLTQVETTAPFHRSAFPSDNGDVDYIALAEGRCTFGWRASSASRAPAKACTVAGVPTSCPLCRHAGYGGRNAGGDPGR